MTKIQTLPEITMNRITELSEAAICKYRSSILPIYGSTETGSLYHIGTAIAANFNNQKMLLTAAHVIDKNQHSSLYIGGKEKLILLEMDFLSSAKIDGQRCKDRYDFAVGRLSKEMIHSLKGTSFISSSDVCTQNFEPEGTFLTLAGYPNSKNKKFDHAKFTISPKLFHYSDMRRPCQKLVQNLNISEKSHVCIKYDQKYSQDTQGQRINSIKLNGLSGGPIFNIGQSANSSVLAGLHNPKPCLTGLIIEYHKEQKAIVSTRIKTIINAIKHLL